MLKINYQSIYDYPTKFQLTSFLINYSTLNFNILFQNSLASRRVQSLTKSKPKKEERKKKGKNKLKHPVYAWKFIVAYEETHTIRTKGSRNDPSLGATWLVGTAMLTSSLANRVQGKGFVREWRSNGIRFYRGSYRGFIIRFWHVRAFTPVRATIGLASGFLFLRREQNEETESTTIPRPDRTSPPLSTLLGCITSSSRVPCHFYRERRVYLSEEMP